MKKKILLQFVVGKAPKSPRLTRLNVVEPASAKKELKIFNSVVASNPELTRMSAYEPST